MLKLLLPLTMFIALRNHKFNLPAFLLLLSPVTTQCLSNMNLKITLPNFFSSDTMTTSLIMLTLWISALMLSISLPSLNPMLPTLTVLLTTFLTLAFSMNNLLLFYVMFELSLIPIILMILFLGYQPERIQAATYMLLYTVAASLPLFAAIVSLFLNNNHLNLFMFNWNLSPISSAPIWALALTTAFLVKMPLYTLHLWLPKAHVEAPTAGSMILAALLLKLGSYGLFRTLYLLPNFTASIAPLLLAIGSWGAVLTTIVATRQTDFKALIAYSSVAHMSFMLAAILTLTSWGWAGAYIAMLTHGLCSSALFALAGITFDTTNTRSLLVSKGQTNIFPKMSLWWFIFCASNMAAPPFMNLLSEIMIFSSVMSKSAIFLVSILLSSFLAALYNLHLYTSLNHGPPPIHLCPQQPTLPSHHSSLLFHLLPLFMLSLKPEILLW